MMNRTVLKTMAALSAFAGSTLAYGQLTPEDITVETDFAFESEYSFRGEKLGGPSMQPGMEIGIKDAYIGTWMSMPLRRNVGAGETNEVDFYGGWVFPVSEMMELDVGYTYYWYPTGALGHGHESEPYAGVLFDTFLNPALYAFFEHKDDVFTLEGSAGHAFDLADFGFAGFELDLGAYLGFVTDSDDDYVYYGGTADIVYALNDTVAFSFGARLAGNSDDDVVDGPQQQLWWGTAVSMAY